MPADRWRVFLHTNIPIAGIHSRTGASGYILDLGEAGDISIVVSSHVLSEADRVFRSKFSPLIDRYRTFIRNLGPELAEDPSPSGIREAEGVIDPGDAPILAAAKLAKVDYLVTLDTKHFHTPKVRAFLPIPTLTPSELLTEFRNFWEKL